ncbi:MAG: hypothetical protein ACE5GY_06730 [Thermodesulfobacteriota bacterium]
MAPIAKSAGELPPSIRTLKESSAAGRRRLGRAYASIDARPVAPGYLDTGDIIASHMQRSVEELGRRGQRADNATGVYAYTRAMTGGYALVNETGALSEVCVGVMSTVLNARGSLGVAAGFFSTMVACIDDYLDREGSYAELGHRLFYISHAYRDLMEMALDEQAVAGVLSAEELYGIKARLFDVIKTLAGSESAVDADRYLYEKSCGDKVIGVLFPASDSSPARKEACAGIGRLVGEAGQLIDDIIDYESDVEHGRRNYIAATGTGVGGAIEGAKRRLTKARALAHGIEHDGAVSWILDSLGEITGILAGRNRSGQRIDAGVLGLSASLKALMPKGIGANQFLIWF